MGIKKIISNEGDIDITHACAVQQVQGEPVAIIFDENEFHQSIYENMTENPDLEANFQPMIVHTSKGHVFLASLALRTKDDFLEYTIQPSIEFIDLFRNKKSIVFYIEKIQYGFGYADMYTKDFDEMYDKYMELKQKENFSC